MQKWLRDRAASMDATSDQYNLYGSFTRLFLMKASKMFIPFRAFHVYNEQKATFVVRVASLFNVVDVKGEDLTTAETVTLLNDMCIFVPGIFMINGLHGRRSIPFHVQLQSKTGNNKVSAILYFNEKGELINFVLDDRYALQDDDTEKSQMVYTRQRLQRD